LSDRPDTIDLIGPAFDRNAAAPAARTLIICSAPRAGSYELCRYLAAAGIGVPHEYFSPNYSRRIAGRWELGYDPIAAENLARYIELLRVRRSANGVFATKVMYRQLRRSLLNEQGARLFDKATIIHIFRPDVAAQFASFRTALETGRYDFSERNTQQPRQSPKQGWVERAVEDMDRILEADMGFRRLFILLGVRPIFVTTDELFAKPKDVVARIAEAVSVTVDESGLDSMIALGKPYSHAGDRARANADLADAFRDLAFRKTDDA
jgi:LPS sulfotransferase NodH